MYADGALRLSPLRRALPVCSTLDFFTFHVLPCPVYVNGHFIAKNAFLVSIQSSVTLFGIVKGTGDIEVGVDNGLFKIAVNELSVDLFILSLKISGYIRSDGQFNLTGSLSLPSALKSGDGQWGITGSLSV